MNQYDFLPPTEQERRFVRIVRIVAGALAIALALAWLV